MIIGHKKNYKMNSTPAQSTIVLQNGLSLKECLTSGSMLEINMSFQDCCEDTEKSSTQTQVQCVDTLGAPIDSFQCLEKETSMVDAEGYVKKKLLESGGGPPLHEGCTVDVAYAGYWEKDHNSFDFTTVHKPLRVDLKDNGLLPGLSIAIQTMLVGEFSLFLLSYEVMYGIAGVPPKIKPKARCAYYIKLIRSVLTPKDGPINFSESNIFQRVHKEVRHLYMAGVQFHSVKNYSAAIQSFRKGVSMLHRCRLANESEERTQELLLQKLYMNLAICYNKTHQPLKACTACNEINRLSNIWNNSKALFQNAKALRMIGDFKQAEKKLKRALVLCPDNEEMRQEVDLLNNTWNSYNKCKIIGRKLTETGSNEISEEFKTEVVRLVEWFKKDVNLCTLSLPTELNNSEINYIKKICEEQNIYWSKVKNNIAFDKLKKSLRSNIIEDY